MKNLSCTVKFDLITRRPRKDGTCPIYCRIMMNRKKAEFKIGEHTNPKYWDFNRGIPKRKPRLKEMLNFIEADIMRIRRELVMEGEEVTAQRLKAEYLGLHDTIDTKGYLMNYFSLVIERYEKREGDIRANTIQRYRTTKRILTEFLKTKKIPNIPLNKVSLGFIKDFDAFLLSREVGPEGRKMNRNTANGYHARLRTVLKSAYDEELISRSPYHKFQLKEKTVEIEVLSERELKYLRSHELGKNKSLQRVRDIFMFSCYTGLRYIDAMRLSEEHIQEDGRQAHFWNLYFIR